jgi:ketosteroid isomerase-like protein
MDRAAWLPGSRRGKEGDPMDADEAPSRWAAAWTAAWKAHDVEAIVALYADDCVHRPPPGDWGG